MLIGVPNIASLNARLFRCYSWYFGAPVHPFNYSVRTLAQLLMKHGFVVDRVAYNGDYTGVLGSLQILANRHTWRRSSQGRLINSRLLHIVSQWLARLLNIVGAGDATELTCHIQVHDREAS